MANLGSKTLITTRNLTDRFLVTQSGDAESKEALPKDILSFPETSQVDDYVLVLTDGFTTILMNKGTAVNLTVPPNSSVAFPVGTQIAVRRIGAGLLTFIQGSGVTITASLGTLTDAAQNALMLLTKTAENTWYLDNGTPNDAVPTTRTLAGLDLSANRTASALNIALGIAPPYITGRLYGTSDNYTAKSTGALGASSIRGQPFLVKRELSIDALVSEVTTVGSFNFRLSIYTDNGSGYPDALVAQTSELDGSTPAAPSLRTGAVSATLQPGLYWLCIVCAGSITFRVDGNGGWPSDFLGFDNSSQATIRQPYYSVALTYGSFPATFPVGAVINTNAGSGTNAPIVWVKKA